MSTIIVTDYTTINNITDFLLSCPIVYFDLETTGLDPYTTRILMLSIHGNNGVDTFTFVFDIVKLGLEVIHELHVLLENPDIIKVAHNAVFDWKHIYHHTSIYPAPVYCTMIAEQIIKSGLLFSGFGLDDVAERRLKIHMDKSVRAGFIDRDLSIAFTEEELQYAATDTIVLESIYAQQQHEIMTEKLDAVIELESALIPITAQLEYNGIAINADRLRAAKPVVEQIIHTATYNLQNEIISGGGASEITFDKNGYSAVNVGSPKQVLTAFNEMGIKVKSLSKKELSDWDAQWARKNKKESAAEDNDDEFDIGYAHPVLKQHAIRTAAAKLQGTYVEGLLARINPVTHRIHPGFKQCGAVSTGRMSSISPNFQNLMNKRKLAALGLEEYDIRSMFIPAPGCDFVICVSKGTRVSTTRGEICIENIIEQDQVVQETGNVQAVTRVIHNGFQHVLKIVTDLGFEHVATDLHRIRCIDENGRYIWKFMSHLQIGDYVAIQPVQLFANDFVTLPQTVRTHHNQNIPTIPEYLNDCTAEFLGYIVGDGCIKIPGSVSWVVNIRDTDLYEYIKQVSGIFGIAVSEYASEDKGVYSCALHSTLLNKWMHDLDISKEHIPDIIWCSPRPVVAAFLRGLFEADGSITVRHVGEAAISFASSRKQIVLDVQKLLLKFGVYSRVCCQVCSVLGKSFDSWRLCIYETSNTQFISNIGFLSNRKRAKALQSRCINNKDHFRVFPGKLKMPKLNERASTTLLANVRNLNRRVSYRVAKKLHDQYPNDYAKFPELDLFVEHGQIYTKIIDIIDDGVKDVYDISVTNTATYITGGVVNHNCDYSGVELAILAAMSNDEHLTRELIQGDVHAYVANSLAGKEIKRIVGDSITEKNKKSNPTAKGIRDLFKPVSYGIIYGSTGYNLYRTLYFDLLSYGITITPEITDRWVDQWKNELFPQTGVLLQQNADYAITRYYTESALGRRRHWEHSIRYDKWRMLAAMREGSNQPIQATCADALKRAMLYVDARMDKTRGRIVAPVHDELLIETRHDYTEEGMTIVKEEMERAIRELYPRADPLLFQAEPKASNCYDK